MAGRFLRLDFAHVNKIAATALVTYVGFGTSLISAPLLAHALGPSGRGSLAAAFAAVQVVSWIGYLGLPRGLSVQDNSYGSSSAFGVIIIGSLSLFTAVACFFLAPELSNGDEWTTNAIRIASATLLFAGVYQLGVEFTLIQGRIAALNVIRAFTMILPSIGYILLFIFGALTLQNAFLVTLAGQLGASLAGLIASIPLLRRLDRSQVSWSFSLRLWSSTVSEGIATRVDQMILAIVAPPAALGVYAIAATGAAASGGLTQAMNSVAYGRIAIDASDHKAIMRSRTILGIVSSLITSTFVLILVGEFNTQLLGPGFETVSAPLAILCFAQLLNDQWQLRVFMQSATRDSSWLLGPSIAGLIVMALAATLFVSLGDLNPVTMAMCVALNSLSRLTVWTVGRRLWSDHGERFFLLKARGHGRHRESKVKTSS